MYLPQTLSPIPAVAHAEDLHCEQTGATVGNEILWGLINVQETFGRFLRKAKEPDMCYFQTN